MEEQFKELIDLLSTIHIFASLSEEQLLSVADRLDTLVFQENQVIFEKGEPADGLYIISSGRVSIFSDSSQHSRELSTYEKGDFFGEEGMVLGQYRKSSAFSRSSLVVYHLKSEQIEDLAEVFPEIVSPIRLAINSYHLIRKKNFKWRAPREAVQFVAREHLIFLIAKLALPLVFALISLSITGALFFRVTARSGFAEFFFILDIIAVLGWIIWVVVDWSNDYAIITNRRAVTLEKVALLYEKRREAPLDAILAVETSTGQIGRWFGFGNVIIRTFTGNLVFKNLAHPELVVRLVNEERSRAKVLSKRNQRYQKEDAIRQRLGYANRTQDPFEDAEKQNTQTQETVKSGFVNDWLSTFFRLRQERNGIITYRTHWFILLKKIFFPTLFIFLLSGVFILRISGTFGGSSLFRFLVYLFGFGLIAGLWWLYQYFDWRNDRYIITQDQLIDVYKKPLGQEQKRSAPIKNIQTVEFERLGIISLLLNFGTVFIRVGDTTFTFDYVYNPSSAQSEIFERYQEFNNEQKEREHQRLQQEMADWIVTYHQVVQNGGTPPPAPQTDEFSGYNIKD